MAANSLSEDVKNGEQVVYHNVWGDNYGVKCVDVSMGQVNAPEACQSF